MGFVVLCLGALTLVALCGSVLTGLALLAGRRRLQRLAPAAQARLLLTAALVPLFFAFAAFAGWHADIFLFRCHAHGCLRDHGGAWPPAMVTVLVVAMAGRVGSALVRIVRGIRRAHGARRAMESISRQDRCGVWVLPVDTVQAFVMGVRQPRVYVSRGLLAGTESGDLPPVLAHEEAHARRRDPLRRLIASIGLAFHLPGIASRLDRRLARAHEMAADAAAAQVVGDAPRVAEVLVRLARLHTMQPAPLMASFGGDLEARVHDLLRSDTRSDRPGAALLLGAAMIAAGLAIWAADPIHHAAELLLRVLSQ